jgi:hypothetical protein
MAGYLTQLMTELHLAMNQSEEMIQNHSAADQEDDSGSNQKN